MKKKYVMALLVLSSLTSVAKAALPTSPLLAVPATSSIKIDGAGDDAAWTANPWIQIAQIFQSDVFGTNPTVDPALDLSAQFKITYNASKIFLLFEVTDDIVIQDAQGNGWLGDKLEIYFGLPGFDPTKGLDNGGVQTFNPNPHARQFAVSAIPQTLLVESGSQNYLGGDAMATNGVVSAFVKTATGYIIEMSIDRAIALENVADNSTVAFDVYAVDHDVDTPAGWDGDRNRKTWFFHEATTELWGKMTGAGQLTLNGTSTGLKELSSDVTYTLNNNILKVNLINAADFQVFDIAGKSLIKNTNTNQVNVSNLNAGIYIVHLQEGTVTKNFRFFKN